MGTLTKPYTFSPGTFAVASQVNAVVDTLFNWANGGSAMWSDGSVAFSGIPLLPNTDPTTVNHAVRKRYHDNAVAIGVPYAGPRPAVPVSWRIQSGYSFVQTDGNGHVNIPFPAPFTTACIAVVGNIENSNNTNNGGLCQPFNGNLTSANFLCYGIVGGASTGSLTPMVSVGVRVLWFAIGY